MSQTGSFEFGDPSDDLPPQERFPSNEAGRQVRDAVEQDLLASKHPLIITGYTSLDKIIDFLAKCHQSSDSFEQIRVLLGHEPTLTARQEFRSSRMQFSQELRDYWLDRGISVTLCAKVIAALSMIESKKLITKISKDAGRPVHAKIYKGDTAITLGSSNFSWFGLTTQIEGNARFVCEEEPTRFAEASLFAEYIWEKKGQPYDLAELLRQLLREVTWQEALARACAEVLEGKWAKSYISPGDDLPLWPSQEQGVAQAMWVIENCGSVLIADATGSGKTRMAACLMRNIADHLARTGRRRRDLQVLLCPPGVLDNWERDLDARGHNAKIVSDGSLSRQSSDRHKIVSEAVRRAQVLVVDEAHNYLNPGSQRTQALSTSMADHIILLTATPINKGAQDLMAMIDLLGADNFEDDVLRMLRPLWGQRNRLDEVLSQSQIELLRDAIKRFTVRRTKPMLNRLIDKEPARYTDRNGKMCRYPEHRTASYTCNETEQDRRLADQIWEQARRLRGLISLRRPLQLSEAQERDGLTEVRYLELRLKGARGLAGHHVMSSLRSSGASLFEHLHGTVETLRRFDLPCGGHAPGSINKLHEIAGHPLENRLSLEPPVWLTDAAAHRHACSEEVQVYQQITALAEQLTSRREDAKAKMLAELLKRHKIVMAFDHHPITLYDLRQRLQNHRTGEVVIATGVSGKKNVNDLLRHGSTERDVIALCSDVMSEGRNLQAASVVVHLDMPSVIRHAEQRIGRVERIDSEHEFIEAYWPDDADEFKLTADEKFYARHQLVSDLIGSNVPLPHKADRQVITHEQIIAEMQDSKPWDGLQDAFEPVRGLLEGENQIIATDVYDKLRSSTARVLSSVSAVQSARAWCFFAVAGTEWGAPRWVFLENVISRPITDLSAVVNHLRQRLTSDTQQLEMIDEKAATLLTRFVNRLTETEILLLPKKKQRALEEMEAILKHYAKEAKNNRERLKVVNELLGAFPSVSGQGDVDLAALADEWLDAVRPVWREELLNRKRVQPLRLKDIQGKLKRATPVETARLQEVLRSLAPVRPLAERVVAVIIGIPTDQSPHLMR